MPKLTRYLQKIFANNSNEVGVFGTGVDKETSKNVETLQSSDYENGWSSAIITNKNYPIWQEMDGVQYGLSYQLKYLFQNGIPEWLSTETYYENSYCRVGSTIYYSLQDNNTNHNPALNDGWWTPLLTSTRSIGEIIPSCVPLTDAGLHLLDGSLISNGIYADFITYIANLTATAPDCFCTEQEWQASVTQYGVCGKFVYDSVNNTVRLPKITGFIEGTIDSTKLGDLVEAGLPNITATFSDTGLDPADSLGTSGAMYRERNYSGNYFYHTEQQGAGQVYIGFDASRSSSIYGNSNTVQPQSVKVFYYIVIATSTKTDIQVDIDEIATDLNGKLDKSGGTVTGNLSVSNALLAIEQSGGNPVIQFKNVPTGSGVWNGGLIQGYDTNNRSMGTIQIANQNNGNNSIYLTVTNPSNGQECAFFGIDVDSNGNVSYSHPQIVDRYSNGSSWYRVYSDGWCEQGGLSSTLSITLVKSYRDTNYTVVVNSKGPRGGNSDYQVQPYINSVNNVIVSGQWSGNGIYWYACGYIR